MGIDRLFGICYYFGFGMECYSQSGNSQHGEVIGSVTYGNGLRNIYFFYLGN